MTITRVSGTNMIASRAWCLILHKKSRVYQILQLSCQFPNYRSKYGLSVKYTIVFTWCCDTCVGITPFEVVMSFLHVFADDDITSHLTTKLSGACSHYLPPHLYSIHCSQCVLNHPPFLQASTINFFRAASWMMMIITNLHVL